MADKLCLDWSGFKENLVTTFSNLRDDADFTDVTLACEDGTQLMGHRLVLAASSSFFENILRRNRHVHPLILMRRVKSDDLVALLDFLYFGQASVRQENLKEFLRLAEELEVKGLSRDNLNNRRKARSKDYNSTVGPK